MLPSPDILNEFEYGKFVLSNLAAKRAKQLREGAPPLVQIDSHHPLTIALAEIAAGRIKPVLGPAELAMADESREITLITDEPLPAELGMLLPALDETEAALVGAVVLAEDEHEAEADHEDSTPVSLTDLVEEEEEVVPQVADEETLSLSDIAEQETSLEDEEAEE